MPVSARCRTCILLAALVAAACGEVSDPKPRQPSRLPTIQPAVQVAGVVTLPDFGSGSTANAINDAGTIVGSVRISRSEVHAARWTPEGALEDLTPTLGTGSAAAVDINAAGEIAGFLSSFTPTGFLLPPGGSLQVIPGLRPFAINDLGEIVGTDGSSAVVRRADGSVTVIALGRARGINNAGVVVGQVKPANQAFRWTPVGGVVVLPSLFPGGECEATAINEAGQVAGECENDLGTVFRAVLWEPDNQVVDLGTLIGGASAARDINELGRVVGTSTPERAFLWDPTDRTMNDLGPGFAFGLNNVGQVVGNSSNRATRWTISAPADCPPDPWFQDPRVISELADLWDQSNPKGPAADRVERGAWIVEIADGFDVIPTANPNPDPCSFSPGEVEIPPNTVARVHTHVFTGGEIVPPNICATEPEGGIVLRGPSEGDQRSARRLDEQVALVRDLSHYILDPEGILKFTVDEDGLVDSLEPFGQCGVIS